MGATLVFDDVPGNKGKSGGWKGGYYWKEGTVFVTRVKGPVTAIVYMAGVNIDFDGSPTAYGPSSKPGDDDLKHAGPGAENGWYGVFSMTKADADKARGTGIRPVVDTTALKDVKGRYPVVQQRGEPSPGHYVSATAAVFNGSYDKWRQERYWDSSKYPYGALSGELRNKGSISMHDLGLAIRIDRAHQVTFGFKDAGPGDHSVGEVSQKVHKALGGTKTYDNNYHVLYIVFPGSSGGKATKASDFEAGVKEHLAKLAEADNGDELAVLLAFHIDGEKGKAALPQLEALRAKRGELPSTAAFKYVLESLRKVGWPAKVGGYEQQMSDRERTKTLDFLRQKALEGKSVA